MKWPFSKPKQLALPAPPQDEPIEHKGLFSTHQLGPLVPQPLRVDFAQPAMVPSVTSDKMDRIVGGASPAQVGFYAASASFIGYQACAMLSTNWLIDKACSMPARDAIRNGFALSADEEVLRKTDEGYNVEANLSELIQFGRVYGGRAVLFIVSNENPDEWYKAPFNIDGVKPNTYKGMSQIDPNWMTPVMAENDLRDPASQTFYTPTYYRIGDRLIHRSHLHIFVPHRVPDFLKPSYNYLGVPVPQRIMERVYAAERSANEAPQLLMTKRTTALQVSDAALANRDGLQAALESWTQLRDNYGVKVNGPEESIQQFDTALGDVDSVIMTQYQLVASAANVPATKLLGVQPKGFNATGDYEASSYREELESVQTHDLTPLLKRHYELVSKSHGIPASDDINIQWMPIDSPTAEEWTNIEKVKADRDAVLFGVGAIDAEDIRTRISSDRDSDYYGIEEGSLDKTIAGVVESMMEGGNEVAE